MACPSAAAAVVGAALLVLLAVLLALLQLLLQFVELARVGCLRLRRLLRILLRIRGLLLLLLLVLLLLLQSVLLILVRLARSCCDPATLLRLLAVALLGSLGVDLQRLRVELERRGGPVSRAASPLRSSTRARLNRTAHTSRPCASFSDSSNFFCPAASFPDSARPTP
jgi:hypothetical protein